MLKTIVIQTGSAAALFLLAALSLSRGLPAAAAAEAPDLSKLPPAATAKVDFVRDIHPIFKESCFSCHGPEKQKGKYRMDTREGAFKAGESGPFILPGKSDQSLLIHMVSGLVEEGMMPPPSDKPGQSQPLSREQIGLLRAWIDQGATWPEGPIQEVVKPIGFTKEIKPLFQASCAECHSGANAKGGFSIDSREAVLKGGKGYGKIIEPGKSAKSSLLLILSGKDEDLPFPDKHKLGEKQVEQVRQWIDRGAAQ